MREINSIVIHHTATGTGDTRNIVDGIKEDWNGVSPYHYYIGYDGTLIQEKKDKEIAGSTLNTKINQESIAIVFVGNFEDKAPTMAQYNTAINLIKHLKEIYGNLKLYRHDGVKDGYTVCPGQVDVKYLDSKTQIMSETEKLNYEAIQAFNSAMRNNIEDEEIREKMSDINDQIDNILESL